MCFALSGVADGLGDALGEAEVKPMWPRLVEAVKRMRKIAGRSRAEYARLVGVSPRVLIEFERGVGNPK